MDHISIDEVESVIKYIYVFHSGAPDGELISVPSYWKLVAKMDPEDQAAHVVLPVERELAWAFMC